MTTKIHAFSIRLPRLQRWATYLTLALIAASGLVWLLLHDVLHLDWPDAERRLLVAHGVAAALSFMVVGGLLPLHVRLAWRIRRNVWSGVASLGLMGLLGVTALLLYYGDEASHDIARWLHIGAGVIAVVSVPFHVWLGRRYAASKNVSAERAVYPMRSATRRSR